MRLSKYLLEPLVVEFNSRPCPYCGASHRVAISNNPVVYLEPVGEEGCARWVSDLRERAKAILSAAQNPTSDL